MRNDWSGQLLPHPPGRRRWVGDVAELRPETAVQTIMERCADYRPLLEQQVFRTKFVFVTGAELGAELCDESRFEKALPPALVALREFAGDGLFTAYNHEPNWQLAHDLLLPAFTRPAMQRYHDIMLEAVRELVEALPDEGSGTGAIDVASYMTKLTMETIARAAFSHDFGSFTQAEPHPFVPAMITALETGRRMGALSSLPGSGIVRRRLRKRNADQQAYVDTMLDDLIAERRAGGGGGDDLLGIMLSQAHPETGERLSDRAIRHQILTFLVAGHETTSGALSFALYYLARNPEVLAQARAETDAILGADPDAEPTFEQVPKFRHVRRVLDEALRLWPTAPGFARSPRETTTVGGYTMRPQDWAIVLLPMVHRDPAVWGEDADEFDPDRFLPERSRGRMPHSYKPFGTGERACIGRQFALHEAVLVLARLVHRFDLVGDPAYDLRVTERLTMIPVGFELALRPRVPASAGAEGPNTRDQRLCGSVGAALETGGGPEKEGSP